MNSEVMRMQIPNDVCNLTQPDRLDIFGSDLGTFSLAYSGCKLPFCYCVHVTSVQSDQSILLVVLFIIIKYRL